MIRGIRGATTVKADSKAEILSATKELLSEMVKSNGVKTGDICSAIFSLTKDLKAVFPAEGAREMGWTFVPLFCVSEINVSGSLKRCVRVLLHVNTKKQQKDIKHVYLREAKILRKEF